MAWHRFDVSKIVFYGLLTCAALGSAFAFGFYSAAKRTVVFDAVGHVRNSMKLMLGEASTMAGRPEHFLQPARYDGAGVTVNDAADNNTDLILLSGFFDDANALRLIRRYGDLVAEWPVRFSELFPDTSHLPEPPATDWNVDIHGALALPDGAVVFNFEMAGLVKLDRCGEVVWTLPRRTHHSVERAEAGGFWVPATRWRDERESPFPPFLTPLWEDTVLRVSEDGKVLAEFSVPELFYENGIEAVLTASGHSFTNDLVWDKEILHLNKITELTSDLVDDFASFSAGDLMLSIREMNLIMVVDPDRRKIKWWQTGPWLRQHDPEFRRGGKIVVFNNNVYRTAFDNDQDKTPLSYPIGSDIIEIDPESNEAEVIYGTADGQEMLTVVRGKVELTVGGGLLITEFEGGRVFETDGHGAVVWEYINRYNEKEVAEITEARVYPATYFTVEDWSCPGAARAR
jgi:Arylsulfotransferase (ASST)